MQLVVGFFLAAAIAYTAHRARTLSKDGAVAAAIVGTIVFGLGGWAWALLLLAFFISSSILTRAFSNRKQSLNEKFSKGGRRDAGQVLGNGSIATAFVLLHAFFPASTWPWALFAASLASVTADTWATELGVLSPTPPLKITDLGQRVDRGTSGAVSPLGTGAALLGSALIGLLGALLAPSGIDWPLFLLVSIGGLCGSLFDSLLGATVQAMYYCPADEKETEKHPRHTCGTETVYLRGWIWLDNDWVNFACGAFGVLVVLVAMSIPI